MSVRLLVDQANACACGPAGWADGLHRVLQSKTRAAHYFACLPFNFPEYGVPSAPPPSAPPPSAPPPSAPPPSAPLATYYLKKDEQFAALHDHGADPNGLSERLLKSASRLAAEM